MPGKAGQTRAAGSIPRAISRTRQSRGAAEETRKSEAPYRKTHDEPDRQLVPGRDTKHNASIRDANERARCAPRACGFCRTDGRTHFSRNRPLFSPTESPSLSPSARSRTLYRARHCRNEEHSRMRRHAGKSGHAWPRFTRASATTLAGQKRRRRRRSQKCVCVREEKRAASFVPLPLPMCRTLATYNGGAKNSLEGSSFPRIHGLQRTLLLPFLLTRAVYPLLSLSRALTLSFSLSLSLSLSNSHIAISHSLSFSLSVCHARALSHTRSLPISISLALTSSWPGSTCSRGILPQASRGTLPGLAL